MMGRRGLPRPTKTRVWCCVADVRTRLASLGHLAECPADSEPRSDHAFHHLNADCPACGDRKALPQLRLIIGGVHPIPVTWIRYSAGGKPTCATP